MARFYELVGLPVVGAVAVAGIQVSSPTLFDKIMKGGSKFDYVMLRVNDDGPNRPLAITNLNLTEHKGMLSGELHIPPDGTRNIPPEGGRRVYSGFLGGDGFLVLAYRSDPPLHGIGAYFLAENNSGDYTGHAQINICTNRGQIIKQCNAVLTKNQGRAITQYNTALKEQCQLIEFPPSDDDSNKVAQKEPCPQSFQTGRR